MNFVKGIAFPLGGRRGGWCFPRRHGDVEVLEEGLGVEKHDGFRV